MSQPMLQLPPDPRKPIPEYVVLLRDQLRTVARAMLDDGEFNAVRAGQIARAPATMSEVLAVLDSRPVMRRRGMGIVQATTAMNNSDMGELAIGGYNQAETFGAKLVQEALGMLPAILASRRAPSIGELMASIDIAKKHGLDEVAAGLTDKVKTQIAADAVVGPKKKGGDRLVAGFAGAALGGALDVVRGEAAAAEDEDEAEVGVIDAEYEQIPVQPVPSDADGGLIMEDSVT